MSFIYKAAFLRRPHSRPSAVSFMQRWGELPSDLPLVALTTFHDAFGIPWAHWTFKWPYPHIVPYRERLSSWFPVLCSSPFLLCPLSPLSSPCDLQRVFSCLVLLAGTQQQKPAQHLLHVVTEPLCHCGVHPWHQHGHVSGRSPVTQYAHGPTRHAHGHTSSTWHLPKSVVHIWDRRLYCRHIAQRNTTEN